MKIVEESSWCNDILYYKSLLFLECIQLMGRPKKETVYNSLGTEGVYIKSMRHQDTLVLGPMLHGQINIH